MPPLRAGSHGWIGPGRGYAQGARAALRRVRNADSRAEYVEAGSPEFQAGLETATLALGPAHRNFVRRSWLYAYADAALGMGAATAAVLFAVLGFRWVLLSMLVIEVVPGLQVFPLWTLAVAAMAATESGKEKDSDRRTK
jgi:hypothetical protein